MDHRNGKPSELTNEAAANEAVLAQQAVLEIVAFPPDSGEQEEEQDSGSLERNHSGQLIRRIERERLEEEREVYNIHIAAAASAAADAAVMMGAQNTRMRRLEGVGRGLVERYGLRQRTERSERDVPPPAASAAALASEVQDFEASSKDKQDAEEVYLCLCCLKIGFE
ncbi:expressed unknown protein [Ectocarpus siliculosus]|uniref:Uncharacterized protein n=1 Tax=Ectocarpus siliculosus TaxID=2880 RepID=D7G796_ECTSI|nr:expressed unknown protein [Ectocarpus siliculosus]|eukprot:CBJ27647.1 expressed unknown protein [Ectocarpus siliculosus]